MPVHVRSVWSGRIAAADGIGFDMAMMKMTLDLVAAEQAAALMDDDDDTDPIAGDWNGLLSGMKAAKFPIDQVPFSFMIWADGDVLNGSISVAGMEVPMESFTFDANTKVFTAVLNVNNGQVSATLSGTLADEKLKGPWDWTSGATIPVR